MLNQPLEFAEAATIYSAQCCFEVSQSSDFAQFVRGDGAFAFQQFYPAVCRIKGSKRAGEDGFLHADALQFVLFAGFTLAALGERYGEQCFVRGFLFSAGILPELFGDTLLKVGADLLTDIFLKTPY